VAVVLHNRVLDCAEFAGGAIEGGEVRTKGRAPGLGDSGDEFGDGGGRLRGGGSDAADASNFH